MRRRFEKRVYIALPESPARASMFRLNLGDTPNSITEEQFQQMGAMSEGYSGSDVAVVVREALMEPLRKCQNAKQFMPVHGGGLSPCSSYPNCPRCPMQLTSPFVSHVLSRHEGIAQEEKTQCQFCFAIRKTLYEMSPEELVVPVIEFADFEKALTRAHSSVGVEELSRFVTWTEEFGQDG